MNILIVHKGMWNDHKDRSFPRDLLAYDYAAVQVTRDTFEIKKSRLDDSHVGNIVSLDDLLDDIKQIQANVKWRFEK